VKQLTSWKNVHLAGGIGGIYFEEKELSAILPHYNYGAALAYLWRRFGPPVNGWDGFKELTLYVLTTKMKGVFLTCNCYVDSPHIAFGFGFSEEIYCKIVSPYDPEKPSIPDCNKRREQWPEYLKEIWAILLDAVKELKRPTNVRDWYIDIEGYVKDADVKNPVCYSLKAGYGVTDAYYKRFEEKRKSKQAGT
jgi:hypothetical protein